MSTNIEVRNIIIWNTSWGDFLANGSVPMTGDLNLNGNDINNVNSIGFKTTPTAITPTEGVLQWNSTDGTLNLGMNWWAITLQIGQESFIKVRNSTWVTILNWAVVYFNGSLGNRPTIDKARSDIEGTSVVKGVCTEDIPNNSDGFITTDGYVRQIKTDYTGSGIWGTTWAVWQLLYVSKTTAGQLTNIEPPVRHYSDTVGTVGIVGSSGVGSILVNITHHQTLEWLSDVNGTPLTTTWQIPVWNNATGYFDFTDNVLSYSEWEVPSGTINGSNTNYSLANTPKTNRDKIYLNGIRQKKTIDYTLSSNIVTFVSAPIPWDILLADYNY